MNDAAFANYYSAGAFQQHTDLSTPITSALDHENFINLNNNSNFFDDEQAFLLSVPVAIPQQTSAPPHKPAADAVSAAVCNNNNNNNIPFVQIHTTDLQQQAQPAEKSYRNVFRRKTAEIKSEPIKSEQADASKERTNATPTPPTRNSSCASVESKSNNDEPPNGNDTLNDGVSSAPHDLPAIHKCPSCPYLSLCQLKMQNHIASCFGADTLQSLQCPGCANIFYSIDALNIHLSKDHSLQAHEISTLLFSLNQRTLSATNAAKKPQLKQLQQIQQHQERKSRIFIKSVDCLREPQREDIISPLADYMVPQSTECNNNNSNNNILDLFDAVQEVPANEQSKLHAAAIEAPPPMPPSQKISIKSVDVLREPALLPFDFTLTNVDSGELQPPPQPPPLVSNHENLDVQVVGMEQQKPRPPKIYIRNVDILKEPMMLHNLPNLSFNGNTVVPQVPPNTADVFQANAELLTPTLALSGFEQPLQSNMLSNDAFSFDTMLGGSANNAATDGSSNSSANSMENARFSALDLDLSMDFEQHSVTLLTEPTTPPPSNGTPVESPDLLEQPNVDLLTAQQPQTPQEQLFMQQTPPAQKQKIFIKNVDILKAPQFQQRHEQHQQQRGTLHLRTVDELNLMNRNEVENLIVPNLDHILDLEPVNGSNSWPANDDYTLADDLDCIIINTMAPLMPDVNVNVNPNVNGNANVNVNVNVNVENLPLCQPGDDELETLTQMADDILIDDFSQLYAPTTPPAQTATSVIPATATESSLKHEWPTNESGNVLMSLNSSPPLPTIVDTACSNGSNNSNDMPPLVPMTSTTAASATPSVRLNANEVPASPSTQLAGLPVPPLVLCAAPKPPQEEKQARIYVANNLLPTNQIGNANSNSNINTNVNANANTNVNLLSLAGGTSVRGRPYGAKRTGNAKPRRPHGNADTQAGGKCTVNGCVFRFKSPNTLEYHRRCHNGAINSAQPMVCPECRSTQFSNWNSLHTHLWRTHQIDMELYCCNLCNFKTPIYSRLVNTHSKIHSEERNYKCEQCGKAFKNTKQLKNHRRLHRTQGLGRTNTSTIGNTEALSLHRCEDCGAAFTHLKTLREHLCKQRSMEQAKCEICERVCSSKSSLKLHLQTHQANKRFKCELCDYEASDHNAFRRHRATHRQQRQYACPHCDYTAIQSTAFQTHVQQKHPEQAANLLHKCSVCSYSTINPSLLVGHQAKHEQPILLNDSGLFCSSNPSQIKVESSLLLAHSIPSTKNNSSDQLLHVTLVPSDRQQLQAS